MALRDATDFLVRRSIDTKVGAAVAVVHLALVGWIVYAIFFFQEPDWPMYWMLTLLIDVPGGVLWVLVGALSLLLRGFRPVRSLAAPPRSTLAGALSRIPAYFWAALLPTAIASALRLATLLGIQLGNANDHVNFIEPLTWFGTFGTLVWSDLARRVVWIMLPPARELPPLPPVA